MDNLRAAVRSLLSTPGPTFVVVATVALAIGANTAIFSVVNSVLLRPLGYGDDSRLVVLWSTLGSDSATDTFRLSPADYLDVRDGAEAFGGNVGLYRFIGSTLTGRERPERVGTMVVTPRLFAALQPGMTAGRGLNDTDNDRALGRKLVIRHETWVRRFGADPELVGSSVELDGNPYTVIGITEPGFRFPPGSDDVEMYFPMILDNEVLPERDHRMFDAVARLDDGVSLAAARDEVAAIAAQLAREFADTNDGWGLSVRPLRQELLGNLGTTLRVLSGAVFLVLLIACANVANVLVARSTVVGREFAVRAALGARARDLCRRSLVESLLLGVVGGGGGILLAIWGARVLRTAMPTDIPRGDAVGVDATVLGFAALLAVGSGLLFGLLPAVLSMSPDLAELLKPAGALGSRLGGGRRLREAMVVVQVALAIVLLVAAGLMVRSFARLSEVDPGFRTEGVVAAAVQLTPSRHARTEWQAFYEGVVSRVRELPGVHAAGAISSLPMASIGLGFEPEFTIPGVPTLPTQRPNADLRLTVPGYFDAMDIEVVAGRTFDNLDAVTRRRVALVNETLVDRYFGEVDPVGRTLLLAGLGEVEIIGVAADIRHDGLQSKYESEIFLLYGSMATTTMHVVVRSDLETVAVARAIGDAVREIDPQVVPADVVAMSDLLWESVAQPRFNTALLAGLAACAALLAALGTYAIVAYSVAQRTGEIGIRMALGADSVATISLIVRQALVVVVAGAGLGIVGALGASRFLGEMLFEVTATDPLTYAGVVGVAVLVGGFAAWLPARRATRIDPVTALREE